MDQIEPPDAGVARRLSARIGVVAIFAIACVTPAAGQVCLVQRAVDPSIDGPTRMASADLDGDGDIDVVSVSAGTGLVVWHENDGTDPPGFVAHTIATVAAGVKVVACADVDGDGDVDILTTGATTSTLVWHENVGGSPLGFVQRVVGTPPGVMVTVVPVDLDGDGDLDIVFGTSSDVGWLESDGGVVPSFTVRTIVKHSRFVSSDFLACADMDGDGDLDVVAAGMASPSVRYWENDGASPAGFATMRGVSATNTSGSVQILARDLDGDGDTDVVFVPSNDQFAVRVCESDGGSPPSFVEHSLPVTIRLPNPAAVADIDGDGLLDILLSSGSNSVAWLENTGGPGPGFTERIVSTSLGSVSDAIAADLDGDDRTDLVVSRLAADAIDWFHQLPVEVVEQGTAFATIEGAMAAGLPGQTVLAYPEHFAITLAPTIDFFGKPLVLESRGAAVVPSGVMVTLADGSELRSAVGTPLTAECAVHLVAGASATIEGSEVELAGPVTIESGAGTLSVAGSPATLSGLASFVSRTPIAAMTEGGGGVVGADFDGDGDVDLVVAAGSGLIMYRKEPGEHAYTRVVLGTGGSLNRVGVADIDGDADLDLVTVERLGASKIEWWENDGSGSFTRRLVASVTLPDGVIAADFDGDGDGDIACAVGNSVRWYENIGGSPPSFVGRTLPGSPNFPRAVRVADVDSDGDPDILVASQEDDTIAWYENTGGPPETRFVRHVVSTVADGAQEVIGADVDGDGDIDLVSVSFAGSTVAWHENSGTNPIVWTRRVISTEALNAKGVVAADVDRDGDTDVIVAAVNGNAVLWYENLGGSPPRFAARTLAADILAPNSLAALDADGDGLIDILSTTDTPSGLWIHTNTLDRTMDVPSGALVSVSGEMRLVNREVTLGPGAGIGAVGEVSVDRNSVVRGAGVVSASVVASSGTIGVDAGESIVIAGDYVQRSDVGSTGVIAGTMVIGLGDGTAPGVVSIVGEAELDGMVRIAADPGFAPPIGSSFLIMEAQALAPGSRFATALLPSIGSDRFLAVVYDEGGPERSGASVSVVVVSLAGDISLDPQAGADSGASGVPTGATLADIDGDGDPDLLIALPDPIQPTIAQGSVVILYNADDGDVGNGWEGFGETVQVTAGVGVNPSGIAVGVIDADAQPDIVVANRGDPSDNAPDTVSVLLVGDPTASSFGLSATTAFGVGDQPADVIVFDLDGDGNLDIATADSGSGTISVGWNSGTGTGPAWNPVFVDPAALPDDDDAPVSVRPGDTNAGLYTFIASSNSGSNTIGVVRWNPDRSSLVLDNIPAGDAPIGVVVADLDLDGADDIVALNRNSSSITIVLNASGAGPVLTMAPPATLPISGATPRSIASGDFDGDGSGDIDLAILDGQSIRILRNDLFEGQLGFTPIEDQALGSSPVLIRSGDLNGDGRDDVVAVSESTGVLFARSDAMRTASPVQILLATPPGPLCIGDVNNDGSTNALDFNILAGNFGSSVPPNTGGDLNGDGVVNALDFNILAGDFGCGGS